MSQWVRRQPSEILPGDGWSYAGLPVSAVEPGVPRPIHTAGVETIVLPLAGSCAVHHDGETIQLSGSSDVFAGRTDFSYLPPGARVWLEAEQPARAALPFAAATGALSTATLADAVDIVDANPMATGWPCSPGAGGAAREFQRTVRVGMIGINVPIAVPMAFYSFGGWKASLFGDTHVHGPERGFVTHPSQGGHRPVAAARPV
jgi:KduI/IolB family